MASTQLLPTPGRRKRGSCVLDEFGREAKRTYRGPSCQAEYLAFALQRLRGVFPGMDDETLKTVLDSCNHDIDAAIDKLTSLRIEPAPPPPPPVPQQHSKPQRPEEWIDCLVEEMRQSQNVPDAKNRAGRALAAFEAFVLERQSDKESKLEKENAVLKRAVTIQAQRLQEARDELTKLKRQNEDQRSDLKKAQMTNYSLSVHLRQMGHDDKPTFSSDIF